ncbi:MAG: DUF523 domain-containing protein [Deltaproteobacteria bacterium]|nr:DUF523 domain-containing protein [Deltaproteobacteria bacterium]MBW2047373.1 DUF523 domain-containing protein [Deltaproteobacteria bacterium]MBW2110177.1 DUF523 domain-containing protein [Deltaproteobacteria bacterium]MBW2352683.1 DUF523 domain-containing protein [Deltaproteobacteria bacterium]HDZ91364.1 DUF523 domain-containing protein [Deltaproteobacteria bacterium]
MPKETPFMVSACLLGIGCRYDGGHALCRDLADFVRSRWFIPFCPEQLGGLSTPRPAATIQGGDGRSVLEGEGRVVDETGNDLSDAFRKGARESLKLAEMAGVRVAVVKDRSPSCGPVTPHCDMPSGSGMGVTAALFQSKGIGLVELGAGFQFPPREFLDLYT